MVIEKLTPRERDVMTLVSQGYTIKWIAQNFNMAESTIRNHLQHIYEKYLISMDKNDKSFNRRTRAIYLFNEGEKSKYPLKILSCIKIAEKHIKDYKEWIGNYER